MASQPTCEWIGGSGRRYAYYIYPLPFSCKPDQNGNYIFAKQDSAGRWVPVYIGEGDLNARANNHHQKECITSKRATHFHCHLNAAEQDRRSEEADLLANYQNAYQPTGCNERVGG